MICVSILDRVKNRCEILLNCLDNSHSFHIHASIRVDADQTSSINRLHGKINLYTGQFLKIKSYYIYGSIDQEDLRGLADFAKIEFCTFRFESFRILR